MTDVSSFVTDPSKAKVAIKFAISKHRPVMLWGPPGIGKSDIVAQIGKETDREVIDVRLPLWEPTDIKGIPFYNSDSNSMEWAPPAELPTDENSNAIILLDEINSAAPSVQAAAYQLVLNRRVGTYKLPDGVDIVAAGNRDSDRGVTYRMPAPLANRFVHLEMKASFDSWLEWAMLNNIHTDVIGYLSHAKQDLYDFSADSASKAFATPRSWVFVSELIDDSDEVDEETMMNLIAGSVGDGLAIKFMAHRKLTVNLPTAKDILTEKVKSIPEDTQVSAMYSLTAALCYELLDMKSKMSENKYQKTINVFLRFLMDNFPTEMVVMATRTAIKTYNTVIDPSKIECFDEYHEKYGPYIFAAMGVDK